MILRVWRRLEEMGISTIALPERIQYRTQPSPDTLERLYIAEGLGRDEDISTSPAGAW